jgi:hypothetical protein
MPGKFLQYLLQSFGVLFLYFLFSRVTFFVGYPQELNPVIFTALSSFFTISAGDCACSETNKNKEKEISHDDFV